MEVGQADKAGQDTGVYGNCRGEAIYERRALDSVVVASALHILKLERYRED